MSEYYAEPTCIKVIGWSGTEPRYCGRSLFLDSDYCAEHDLDEAAPPYSEPSHWSQAADEATR